MRHRSPTRFLQSAGGSASVEFVVVFIAFIGIIFFVVEVALYMFFLASLEKAAEVGVRAAVVSPPVVQDFDGDLLTNKLVPGRRYGGRCTLGANSACQGFSLSPCAGCLDPSDPILARMQDFNGSIQSANVTVSYIYAGIGFAGGPTVPMVTVTVHDVPFQTGIMGLLLDRTAEWADLKARVATLPPRSASMTGEDLAL